MSPEDQEALGRGGARNFGVAVGMVHLDLDAKGVNFARPGLDLALRRVADGATAGIIFPYIARAGRLTRDNIDLGAAHPGTWRPSHLRPGEHVAGHRQRMGDVSDDVGLGRDAVASRASGRPAPPRSAGPRGQSGTHLLRLPHLKGTIRVRARGRQQPQLPGRGASAIDELVPVVQSIFQQRADGVGPSDIARELNKKGIVTRVRTRRDGTRAQAATAGPTQPSTSWFSAGRIWGS